jgi:glutamate racemase
VFDSGVGGLTVLHELLVTLPSEDFVYLGDTARFPYGTKTPEQLRHFAAEIADVLLAAGAKLLVVACNSTTAAALGDLRARLGRRAEPVEAIGVIDPAVELATAATDNGRIGLLATPTTVASGAYAAAVARQDAALQLAAVACPELAPIIERGSPFDADVVATARAYCAPLRDAGVDTVILGCTHYPLVAPMLQRMLGRRVRLIASGAAVANRLEQLLERRGLATDRTGEGDYRFLCTGDVGAFRALGTRFLQMPLEHVARIALTEPVAA